MSQQPPPLPSEKVLEKVLIADDDAVVVKALSGKLSSRGYRVCSATDGTSTVKAVRVEKPDLIILDITFPPDTGVPWDGFRLMEWLRRLEESRHIPIICISGGDAEKLKARALAGGAEAYFPKPVDFEQLFAAMRKILTTTAPPHPGSTGGTPQS